METTTRIEIEELANTLYQQILALYDDRAGMREYIARRADIDAFHRPPQGLVMEFSEVVRDPSDPYRHVTDHLPGLAFGLLCGGPPESYEPPESYDYESGEADEQLEALLADDDEFEALRLESVLNLMDLDQFWKKELANRAAAWLKEQGQ